MFDWNETPIVLLGTKAVIYITTTARTVFVPHCNKAFMTDMRSHHYHQLKFRVPATRGYHILGINHLNLSHGTVPTVSKADRTVLAAIDLLEKLETILPPLAQYKVQHL
jgi:predicted class III extradiol MEMO1 family dioxygenase